MKKILVLYSEFMPYSQAVMEVLAIWHETTVVYWDDKTLTPFQPDSKRIRFVKRSSLDIISLKQLVVNITPDVVIVSGRMDKLYLQLCLWLRNRIEIPIIMGSDNQWNGTFRDHLAAALSFFLYRRYFTHAWVPGIRQYEYVRRMGFRRNNILLDLYSGNVSLFNDLFEAKGDNIGQDILFIGRLHPVKGILQLISVVQKLKQRGLFDGKLRIFGSGPLWNHIPNNNWVIKREFADQAEFKEAIVHSKLFCLPSVREPWGVVVHEMASAGLPICCSNACGSSVHFVKHGYNGEVFESEDWDQLYATLSRMLSLPAEKLKEMGRNSNKLAQAISPAISASNILAIL
jgi:glycosyltransferase involved in cell wall biosynthesis